MYVTSLVFLPDSYSKLLYSIQLPKVTTNSTYLKLKANSLPFSSLTNLLLIQHHITTSTSTSARTWTSTPASGLLYCLTPNLPHILQVLWAQILLKQLSSQCPHSGHHQLPISISAPLQFFTRLTKCSFHATLFNIFWWHPLSSI